MRIIAVMVLVFGVALSGGALFFASEYFNEMKASMAQKQKGPETVRVLVAKRELNYGKRLGPKDLQWVQWPKAALPPGSFTSVEALFGEKGDQSRVVLRSIEPGEPVLEGKITKMGESPRMAMNVGDGNRALAISVDATAGVAGFVAPGDRVDIMLIRKIEGQLVSSIVLQDVPIIATDQRSNTEATSPRLFRMVTVEVSIRDAQKLALAQQVGRLSLTLRGLSESTEGAIAPVTAQELNDYSKPEDPRLKVRVRRAGSLKNYTLDDLPGDEQSGEQSADEPSGGQSADADSDTAGN